MFHTPERSKDTLSAKPYAMAAASIAATTLLAMFVRRVADIPDLAMLYLVSVMVTALLYGRGPSLLAAALSVAAYDFFFVPPYLTFAVRDTAHVLTFGMMFLVGTILSTLTTRLKRQEQHAWARERRAAALYGLSGDLGAKLDPREAAQVVANHAADGLESRAFVLTPDTHGHLEILGAAPPDMSLSASEWGVAKWVFEHGRLAGLGTDTLPGSAAVCVQLRAGPIPVGVLALMPRAGHGLDSEQRSFLEAFARQAAFAFERARLTREAQTAALRARTEELRSSLLSAVSHDLRTPLAGITGAATTLRDEPGLDAAVQSELLESICDEAERLERLLANLLDMTRVESGGLEPKREWVPVEEIVGAALTRLASKLEGRTVSTRLAKDLPLLSVDPVLMQQVFVNLLENALKYTPRGSALELDARSLGQAVEIDLRDHGPGLPAGEETRIFEKFYRGPGRGGVAGVGLGLPISRAVVEAHGGTLTAESRQDGGAMFRLRLPVPSGAPALEPES
jgi:two-component system, OmpR family, sensor histidine kinase KdpD